MRKFLLFDFDGVIVDSFQLSFESMIKVAVNPVDEELYRRMFDGNLYEHAELQDQLEEVEDLNDDPFYNSYTPALMAKEPIPGMVEVIEELDPNHKMVIVSSSINSPIHKYLAKHKLTSYFDKVFGADVHKSKVKKMHMVFDEFSVQPDDCVFITDTLGDMREATKAGVKSIGVTWGFQKRKNLEKGNSIAIVDTPEELKIIIKSL